MKKKGDVGLTVAQIAQAKDLAAQGRSCRYISRQLHKSAHTVKRLLNAPAVVAEVKATKAALAEKFKQQSERVLDSICDKDILAASLQQKSISAGVLLDKGLLLAGEPTAINVTALLDVAKMLRDQGQADDRKQVERWRAEHTLPPAGPTN